MCLLILFSLLVPYLANDTPLYISENKKTVIYPIIPYGENQFFDGKAPLSPSLSHPLGSDDRGRDLLVRLLYGFKNNLLFTLSLSFFITTIALFIGMGSVLLPKPLRVVFLLLTESTLHIPFYFLLIAILSVFETSKAIYIACLLFLWSPLALLIRAETQKNLAAPYILSARALGAGKLRIAFLHLLPNCLTPLKSAFPLVFSSLFSLLAFVHYLGIASFEPNASLGELLSEAKNNLENTTLVLSPLVACLIPLYMLMPSFKDKEGLRKLQVFTLSHFEGMEDFFGKKNRFSRFIKLPKQMTWQWKGDRA